jgi:hypothetical protein
MNSPNPIRVLLEVLTIASEQGDETRPIKDAIALHSKTSATGSSIFDFYDLLNSAKRAIQKADSNSGSDATITEIQNIFSKHNIWGDKWAHVHQQLKTGNYLNLLKKDSEIYELRNYAIRIDEDVISEMLDSFQEIIEETRDSNLEAPLKNFIIKHIEEVCLALNQYKIHGIEPLQSALEASLGGLVFNPLLLDNPEFRKNRLVNKIFSRLRKAGVVVFHAASISATFLGIAADTNGYLMPAIQDFKESLSTDDNTHGIESITAAFESTDIQTALPESGAQQAPE